MTKEDTSLEVLAQRRIGSEDVGTIISALKTSGFSPGVYRSSNEDLLRTFADDTSALWHFLAYGGTTDHIYRIIPRAEGLRRLCKLRTPLHFKAAMLTSILYNFTRPDGAFWDLTALSRRYLIKEYRKSIAFMASIYVIMGDSHSNIYKHRVMPEDYTGRLWIPLHILCTGSSARGLPNQASQSGAGEKLINVARSLPAKGIELFFKFGQVDVEFVFNFDRIKTGKRDFDEEALMRFCRQSIELYLTFVAKHFATHPVNIMSIFPPALSDAAWREGYVNAHVVAIQSDQQLNDVIQGVRELEIPSQIERTLHHATFNDILEARSKEAGFTFFDDFTPLIGGAEIVDDRYTAEHGGHDHHVALSPTADVIMGALYDYLNSRYRLKSWSKRLVNFWLARIPV